MKWGPSINDYKKARFGGSQVADMSGRQSQSKASLTLVASLECSFLLGLQIRMPIKRLARRDFSMRERIRTRLTDSRTLRSICSAIARDGRVRPTTILTIRVAVQAPVVSLVSQCRHRIKAGSAASRNPASQCRNACQQRRDRDKGAGISDADLEQERPH